MVSSSDFTSPFGAYALGGFRESIRRLGDRTPVGKPGRILSSACRRLCVNGHERGIDGPHDVEIAPGVRARLYPSSNRCEKRAMAGVHHWDTAERRALDDAIGKSGDDPFIFLDVGANVGLYSLFVYARARRLNRACRVIAVEPDTENRSRLAFNAAASGAEIDIQPVAISSRRGEGNLAGTRGNRGGIGLTESLETGGEIVPLETLHDLVKRLGLPHIDAMKLDIEGHDLETLTAFFETAPENMFPQLLILETGREKHPPLLDLATANGYGVEQRVGINAILVRETASKDGRN